MKKKDDMYLHFPTESERKRRKRIILMALVILVFACLIGAAVYAVSRQIAGGIRGARKAADDVMAEEMQGADYQTEAEDYEVDAGGVLKTAGMPPTWFPDREIEEKPVNTDYDIDQWMPDFVDNRKRVDAKGLYIRYINLDRDFDKILEMMDTTDLNTVVIDVKDDYGYTSFDTGVKVAAESGAARSTIKDMPAIIRKFKEHGVYCVARIVSFRDSIACEYCPEMAVKKQDGSVCRDNAGYAWLNPYDERSWDYIYELSMACAEAGFDEVNYDYIRFSSDSVMKEADYGETGDLTKIQVITEGVKSLCERLKPEGVFVSADVYGAIISSTVDASIVGQSYKYMSMYLDYICPMIYPSHYGAGYYNLDVPDAHPYELVYNAMQDSRKALSMIDVSDNKAIVRPWLQDFTATWVKGHITYGSDQVCSQIDAVYDVGYTGWLLWNAAGLYDVDKLGSKDQ